MKAPHWVSLETALALHDRSIRLFGGSDGVRDQGLLESALSRPQHAFAYEKKVPLHRLAALYAHGIAMNHPFVDGNKRTAFAVCGVFLAKNGLWLSSAESEAATAVIGLAAGEVDESELAAWLQKRVIKLSEAPVREPSARDPKRPAEPRP